MSLLGAGILTPLFSIVLLGATGILYIRPLFLKENKPRGASRIIRQILFCRPSQGPTRFRFPR